jgi:hypothetical protein
MISEHKTSALVLPATPREAGGGLEVGGHRRIIGWRENTQSSVLKSVF